MNMKNLINKGLLLVLSLAVFTACDFTNEPDTYKGEQFAKFGSDSYFAFVLEPQEIFNIEVGLITGNLPESALTLDFTVLADQSTAQAGVHYDLAATSVTIPAGSVTATVPVTVYKAALDNPVTLVLSFGGTNFNQTTTLTIQNPIRDALIGNYALSYPWFFGDGEFAQEIVAGAVVSDVVAPGMLEAGTDITMTVTPSSNEDIYNLEVARQNGWVSGTWGQATVETSEAGTYQLSTGQVNMGLLHRVAAGSFGVRDLTMRKLNN